MRRLVAAVLLVGLVAACGLSNSGCIHGLIRPGLLLVSYVIGLFNWPYISRLVRFLPFVLCMWQSLVYARAERGVVAVGHDSIASSDWQR